MKNLKFLFLPVICLLTAISFVSCDTDDDEPKNNSLIGTWFGTSTRYDEEKFEITFNSNGTYSFIYYIDYYDNPSNTEISKGTYEIMGNVVKLYETEYNGSTDDSIYNLNYILDNSGKILTIGTYASETFVCSRK